MEIKYFNLGAHRRLHEIIFAGSHDASITSGKKHVQTQDLDIYDQAKTGVRLFDLRILALGDEQGASLLGYHGKGKSATTHRMHSSHTGGDHDVSMSPSMKMGSTGLKLSAMLQQAKRFVTDRETRNEFLILKFDKCKNWKLIAETCIAILGDSIYKKNNDKEFSKLTLGELAGKVVCVFNDAAIGEMNDINLRAPQGILGFRSLKPNSGQDSAYKAAYSGMQYCGKGGTKWYAAWKSNHKKMKENYSKQQEIMLEMACANDINSPNVLGMMYWTATGSTSSIRERDDHLWSSTGVFKMHELWRNGLEASIGHQLERERIKYLKRGGTMRMKAFFPNIIMIDFANYDKCKTIFGLNAVKDNLLAAAFNKYVENNSDFQVKGKKIDSPAFA